MSDVERFLLVLAWAGFYLLLAVVSAGNIERDLNRIKAEAPLCVPAPLMLPPEPEPATEIRI